MQEQLSVLHTEVLHPGLYVLGALLCASLIRLLLALLQGYHICDRDRQNQFAHTIGRLFIGKGPLHPSNEERGDYLSPYVLGFLELLAYPILMVSSEWTYVGLWIGFKTVAQYKHWSDNRFLFNRFLIGNALVVILAATLLVRLVHQNV